MLELVRRESGSLLQLRGGGEALSGVGRKGRSGTAVAAPRSATQLQVAPAKHSAARAAVGTLLIREPVFSYSCPRLL